MASEGLLERYDHVLAIRPDASLTRKLHLRMTCQTNVGLNIISGSVQRGLIWGTFHNRDYDLAYLACDPQSLLTYLVPFRDNNATNRLDPRFHPPPTPKEFTRALRKEDCKPYFGVSRYECASFGLMAALKKRVGNLDRANIFVDLINHETWLAAGLGAHNATTTTTSAEPVSAAVAAERENRTKRAYKLMCQRALTPRPDGAEAVRVVPTR